MLTFALSSYKFEVRRKIDALYIMLVFAVGLDQNKDNLQAR
jgi:hypothetical protein